MNDKRSIRERIWRLLEESGVAAFPRPVHGRIPNFKGSEEACRRLTSTVEFQRARVVKINPDAPQKFCRYIALLEGKMLIVPTPRIREGFYLINPTAVPTAVYYEASTISGLFKWGKPVKPEEIPQIDLVVVGSVAVNPKTGRRVGKSHGYSEIEWGILSTFDKVSENTPVATTVHTLQLIEEEIPVEPFDLVVDVVATPREVIYTKRVDKKPSGIYWDYVTDDMFREIPLLRELRR